jgi:hypothetical protein
MKNIFSVLLLLVLCNSSKSQENTNTKTNYPIPEFNNQPVYYDEATNGTTELERPKCSTKAKRNASSVLTGIGKTGLYVTTGSEHSPTRIKKKDTIQFIIRVGHGIDPATAAETVACIVKKGQRTVLVAEVKTFKGSEDIFEKLHYQSEKLQDDVYRLLFIKMNEGEYFMVTDAGVFAFGIDN